MYEIRLNDYSEPEHWAALNEKNLYLSYTADYKPNRMNHMHKSCELLLVEEGGATYTINGVDHSVRKGDLLVIGSMDPHNRNITEFPFIRYGLTLMTGYLESLPVINQYRSVYRTCGVDKAQNLRDLPHPIFDQIRSIFLSIGEEQEISRRGRTEMSYALVLQLTMVLSRLLDSDELASTANPGYQSMLAVRNHIDANYSDDLSLTKLAGRFHLSPTVISRRFAACFEIGISEYINAVRVMNASRLLENTDDNVADIGFEVGYNSVNTFIRQFRKKIGITPLQYRKAFLEHMPMSSARERS